jgi:hypothetical protein
MKHPEHKIQIYSIACFLSDLDNNPIHQNKIFKKILEYICDITNESKQTILYVLLSKCNGMNIEVIQGSITCSHILTQSKIDNIYSIITEKIPLITEIIPCFLTEHPIGIPKNDIKSFLMNGVVGPFPLQNIQPENIDVITNWFLKKKLNDYHSMKHHQDNNNELKELCLNATIHDIVKEYIGYECICYNTEYSLRENNKYNRNDLINYLNNNKIGTRLLFSGNLIKQPYMKDVNFRVHEHLKNTDFVMNNTFWVGLYPGLSLKHLEYTVNKLKDYFRRNAREERKIEMENKEKEKLRSNDL